MDFGSLDFSTWRLVGLGLLALGAIAAVVAIVAIILMFRSGGTVDDRRAAEPEWDDEDDDDDHDVDDADDDRFHDEDDDDRDEDPRDTRRDRDGGPTVLPVGLSGPQESLFTVAAETPPRPPLRSTRDEAHVPSPDWYDYADVDATSAGADRDDDAHPALGSTREAHPPAAPAAPAAPAPSTAEEQSEPADREEKRRASRWFDDTAADKGAAEVSPSFLERYSDTPSAPPAGAPVIFPWERRHENAGSAPERRSTPAPQEPRRQLAERRAERTETGATAAIPITTPHRPDIPPPAAPEPAARQEPQRPTEGRQVEREDTGTIAAVPNAASSPSEVRDAKPALPVRQDPDAPEADWYDDPDGSGGERWWDGKSWTRHRRPRSGAPVTTDTGRQRAIARQQSAAPSAADGRRRTSGDTEPGDPAGASSSRAPGWYRDPSGAGGRRFWDGSRWTTET